MYTDRSQDDFVFNDYYRDSLLFDDSNYSNSKTYFWALQSLKAVNDCIDSFFTTWKDFEHLSLAKFWKGQDEGGQEDTPKGKNISYLKHIKEEIIDLEHLRASNLARQEEIKSLRDGVNIHCSWAMNHLLTDTQLFNASTVREARTSVLQGRNIELITYISMIFLPASFVTSVFGMQILNYSVNIRYFAIIFVTVCGVTYATILLLRFMHLPKW